MRSLNTYPSYEGGRERGGEEEGREGRREGRKRDRMRRRKGERTEIEGKEGLRNGIR